MLTAFKMSEEVVQWSRAPHDSTSSHFTNMKSIFVPSNTAILFYRMWRN